MTNPIELVIFDCDGVLLDSERLAVAVDAKVLAAVGWPLSESEIVERFVGRSHAYMMAEVEAHAPEPLAPGWEGAYQHLYDEAFATSLTTVDGVEDALDAITLPTCVASSSSHSRLRRTLGRTGLLPRFDGRIFSAEDVPNGKPAPDLFLHAAAVLGFDPAVCLVIEDSRHGLAAARAAGMRSLAYDGGLTPVSALAGPGTVVFDDMRRLPELIVDARQLPLP